MHVRDYFWIDYNHRPDSGLRYNTGYVIGMDDYGNAIMGVKGTMPYWH